MPSDPARSERDYDDDAAFLCCGLAAGLAFFALVYVCGALLVYLSVGTWDLFASYDSVVHRSFEGCLNVTETLLTNLWTLL